MTVDIVVVVVEHGKMIVLVMMMNPSQHYEIDKGICQTDEGYLFPADQSEMSELRYMN